MTNQNTQRVIITLHNFTTMMIGFIIQMAGLLLMTSDKP